ncbi:GGDEF domain-containing protein [Ferrimonas pelagia]|uniref:diguanylate cyclase n=1 Tax=Ferrimonas pelagia TaxID=1177826 RepID=A0ABP9F1W1_9GAMM
MSLDRTPRTLQQQAFRGLLLFVCLLQTLLLIGAPLTTPWQWGGLLISIFVPVGLCLLALGERLWLDKRLQCGLVGGAVALSWWLLGRAPLADLLLLLLASVPALFHRPAAMIGLTLPPLVCALVMQPELLSAPLLPLSVLLLMAMLYHLRCYRAMLRYQAARIKRLGWRLGHRSSKDPLTELTHRRYFDQRILQTVSEARRTKSPLSLILLDIDYFERYNERYGYDQGDQLLKTVAQLLKDTSQRQSDILSRFDGGTFALLLPATERKGAERLARQICQQLHRAAIPHGASPISADLTVSLGIAQWQPGVGPEQLVVRASRSMQKAKLEGRNQIKVA